jgi:hypothetical protein
LLLFIDLPPSLLPSNLAESLDVPVIDVKVFPDKDKDVLSELLLAALVLGAFVAALLLEDMDNEEWNECFLSGE